MDTTAADAAGVACLNSLAPGRRILGWYAGDNVWHEMMIGLVVSSELTVIYTPDGDPYMENLTYDRASGPIKLRSLGPRLTLPRNLRAPAYRFRGAITNNLIKSVALGALKLAEDACSVRQFPLRSLTKVGSLRHWRPSSGVPSSLSGSGRSLDPALSLRSTAGPPRMPR